MGGSVALAMRTMFQQINRNLYEHNLEHAASGKQQFETSMIAAVLHEDDMVVARAGPVISALQTAGLTLTFPDDLSDEAPLLSVPLGLLPEPEIAMVRYGVNAGSRLALSDANLADIPGERLTSILLESDIGRVLDGLRRTIRFQSQLMLVELVPPEYEAPMMAAPGESSHEVQMRLGEARMQLETDAPPWQLPRRDDFGSLLSWGLARLAGRAADFFLSLGALFQRFFPLPATAPTRRASSGTLILTVLLIPLLIVSVAVLSWVSNLGETEFEQCLGKLQETAALARSIDSSNRRSTTSAWNATLQIADACDIMRPGDPFVINMQREAQALIDTINNVKRREAVPLTNFENASISRLRLQGTDLYALDDRNDLVYHVSLSDDGKQALRQDPVSRMRLGATYEGYTIGQIADIAFDSYSGDLAMLDGNGTLLRCEPQIILNCDVQRVLNADDWENPLALTIWDRKLYILDSEGGQIWRYDPSGSSYVSAPREYFSGNARPNLRNVVDFTISADGVVYVLYGDGVMKSYISGNEAPFAFSGFNEGSEPHVVRTEGFALNDSAFAPGFFFISRSARAIYETTVAGTFIDSYQAYDQSRLDLISAVVAYPEQNIIYVASGNTIFSIDMAFQ